MPVARLEAQRLERDAELGRPALGGGRRGHPPDGVPVRVDVAALVGDLGVGAGAGGVGREDEAVAAVGEGVEQHLEGVLLGAGEVLVDVVDDDAGRLGIAAARADVEELVVEGDVHLGGLGGRLAFQRVRLHEGVGGRRRLPDGVVEHAVDDDRRGGAHGGERAAAVARRHRQGLARPAGAAVSSASTGHPWAHAARRHVAVV